MEPPSGTGRPAASETGLRGVPVALRRLWPRPWARPTILDSAPGRLIVLSTTGAVLLIAVVWTIILTTIVIAHDGIGVDFRQYLDHTERWLHTGQFYLPRQLAGPTTVMDGDPLYPPVILWLLVPFTVLPAVLWWAIPLTVIVWVLIALRPAPWTWPLLAFIAMWPRTPALILYGNPGMWVVAAIAAAVMWRWPGPLVLIKPSLFPFALIGIGSRGWNRTLLVFVLLCIPFGALWLDYVTVLRNSNVPLSYSLLDVPLALAPVVAWLGRRPAATATPAEEAAPRLADVPAPSETT